ncbi:hypothetical protein [Metallosphaera hakonensis]|uniref:Uncharacterized protein n=1 Tax=Metallosphaera hakonensis JCM 8857 = DSM 7519 TaxID=1293036 RepID=A0A2U9IRW1_9CREN|nr:hypothetical protein [Metallosphaera hakonensis]AWR98781.1 hypothetical protein DFR87_02720 [Metallosphaera hakonensis JCM 8857 = DSM 7519]
MDIDSNTLEIMNYGVLVSQKRRVRIGNYEINFRRRWEDNDYMYAIEVAFEGKIVARGYFSEFKEATIFAGSWIKKLL